MSRADQEDVWVVVTGLVDTDSTAQAGHAVCGGRLDHCECDRLLLAVVLAV